MLRDTDAASPGVRVPASHPVFKNKLPANDPPTSPQGQAAKVAMNAPGDPPAGNTSILHKVHQLQVGTLTQLAWARHLQRQTPIKKRI